jgi:YebC/PmpR family DNA-binding regulatory protein
MTDNRNRAAADVRRVFTKNGGTLGDPGSVAWMFTRKGVVLIPAAGVTEDDLMMAAMEAGADDIVLDGDYWQVTCDPADLQKLKVGLAEAGIEPESARFSMEPNASVPLDRESADKVLKLMDALDDEDDVQEIYANFEISDEIMAEINA